MFWMNLISIWCTISMTWITQLINFYWPIFPIKSYLFQATMILWKYLLFRVLWDNFLYDYSTIKEKVRLFWNFSLLSLETNIETLHEKWFHLFLMFWFISENMHILCMCSFIYSYILITRITGLWKEKFQLHHICSKMC